jgi:diguanylate cyclase (GGDEF)-like protein
MTDVFLTELRLLLSMPGLDLVRPPAQPAAGHRLVAVPDTDWLAQLPDPCAPRTAFQVGALLRQHLHRREREDALGAQLAQLTRELDALVNVSQVAEDETRLGEGILPDVGDIRWAIFKKGTLLINKGLSDHTIVPSLRRLEREAEFSYVVSAGEHWVVSAGRFAVICESDYRISPLMRQMIRLRLEWLNRSAREREMAERMQSMLASHRADVERLRRDEESSRWSALELRQRLDRLNQDFEGVLHRATTDSLTHAYNRAKIEEILAGYCGRGDPRGDTGARFCLLALDVDHFKRINDAHGHPVGDRVLIEVASGIRAALRQTDVLARWGGDEFLVLLPEFDLGPATACGERLRRAVAQLPSIPGLGVSISVGVAMHEPGETAESLFCRADQALYEAKRAGRDRVVAAAPRAISLRRCEPCGEPPPATD